MSFHDFEIIVISIIIILIVYFYDFFRPLKKKTSKSEFQIFFCHIFQTPTQKYCVELFFS